MKKFILIITTTLMILSCFEVVSQTIKINGKVRDEASKEPLFNANVVLKGSTKGAVTDFDGNFSLEVEQQEEITIVISYLGYEPIEKTLTAPFGFVDIIAKSSAIMGKEIVISGSRISETIMESPVQIQKMNTKEIRSASSGDFYQSLGNMKEVDVIQSSIGFKVFNTRGFNSTMPIRVVQFIDGMDNQAPGLNFPVGNLVGANDLDLSSVEVISGAASAMYGANAFQGVISMNTKNPYDYPGLAVQIKGGNRGYMDLQTRYAHAFGEKKKFALKVVASYMQVDDWEADQEANIYGDIETDQNLTTILNDTKNDPETEPETADNLTRFLDGYADFNNIAFPGIKTITAPGYREKDLVDYKTESLKLGVGAHYRFKKDLELSYDYKFGLGSAIYQATNRFSLNDIQFQQHKLELKGKNFIVRGYTTQEEAGDTYDAVFTGIGLSREGVREWIKEYIDVYFDELRARTDGFSNDARLNIVSASDSVAQAAANLKWIKPGTLQFDTLFNKITSDPNLQTGSLFLDESWLMHWDVQYQFDFIKFADVIGGVSYRKYYPKSFGTIFSDTLLNPADTLPNGLNNPNGKFRKITNQEGGGFLQASKKFFGERLKLIASFRLDKNENFNTQYSPKVSAIYVLGDAKHVFRLSLQRAFRVPTLQNQFILLNLGPITLKGNTSGFENLYTLNSVTEFLDFYDSTFVIQPEILKTVSLPKLKPEEVTTLEFGYRTILFNNKFFVDFNTYFNWYENFIGEIRVVEPANGGTAGAESGEDAILTGNFERFQIPLNADRTVRTYGASVGLSYALTKKINITGNYTYADINEDDLEGSDLIPGFNTSNHKFNLGLQGKNIWKDLSFNLNFKWNESYFWQSSFGDGKVPSFHTMDGNISYEFKSYHTTFSVGASNLYNNKYRMVYGGPTVGTLVYASLLFDINKW